MNAPTLALADHAAPLPSLAAIDDPLEWDAFTRWSPSAHGQRMGVSALQLTGLHCAACAGIIERCLRALDGVHEVHVSAAARLATVHWDPTRTTPSSWITALRRGGYDAAPDVAASSRELRSREHRQALWRLVVAAFCAMQVMMLAAPAYFAEPGDLTPDMRQLLNWGSWVLSLPVLWFSAAPFLGGAWRALRAWTIGMDVPVALAILITFIASTGATFDPAGAFGQEVYFDSMTMFVALLLGGRLLELRLRHRSAAALESALARVPLVVLRHDTRNGDWTEVSVHRLRRGDELRVPVGQAFPADGHILRGQTQVDEAMLTGESAAVEKGPGVAVVAGSVNVGAPVEMVVERVGADTRLQGIVAIMRQAMSQRPAAARLADRWAAPFLWAVLLAAAAAALVWHVIDPGRALAVAVSVLIVTCPCALSLALPTTLLAAAEALARRGVIVQRLDALETLARASHIFIDKTGTLTEERLQLREVRVRALSVSEPDVRRHAASLAAWSQHPLSLALVQARPPNGEPAPLWHRVHEHAGRGLSALDPMGIEWRLGSAAFVGVAVEADIQVWLSRAGQPLAGFDFEERVREGSREAVAALHAHGWKVSLLSGDEPVRVRALAARVGITDVLAAATPEDKLALVARAQAAGETVVMVGDGINDAPVLARADVSLAMGQGALISRAQADAVIVSNRPLDLIYAQAIARRAMQLVRQNMLWAVFYNAACIPLALAGFLPPWLAGLGMALSSVVVVLNALRVERGVLTSSQELVRN